MPIAKAVGFVGGGQSLWLRVFEGACASCHSFGGKINLPFVSNMFLDGGWLHLIVNMWTLWLFGRAVEDQLGSRRYLAFYFACGILASVTYAVLNPNSTVPALGASGAIAGILGCYMRFFPFSRIVVLIPILFIPLFFEVPAMLFAGLWFLFQALGAVADWSAPFAG